MRGNPANIIVSLLLCTFSFQFSIAQQKFNYNREWLKVDSLITKKGLTQSALTEVNKIYAAAKKEKNDAQLIKSLFYKMNLQQAKEEDAALKNIREVEKEITSSTEPSRSILKSILAESYWYYFQQHRFLLYDRTTTRNFKKEDIATWDIEEFHKKITALYLESISNEKLLQQTKLEPFDPIILKGNARYLRPTLYDLLAHRALDYFKNDERNLDKPAYAYEINEAIAFSEAKVFASHRFITNDSLSLHHKAVQLFQRLITYHLNDPKPAALIDVDIERISFANNYGVMENKDSLYEQALQKLAAKHPGEKETDQAWYLIAELHAAAARQYDPLRDTSNRFEFVVARKICERVVVGKDSSEGKSNCEALLQEILKKEVSLQTEKVNVPGLPFRTLVSYRNTSDIYFRLIKVDKAIKESLGNSWQEEYWNALIKLPGIKSFSQGLPETNDHQLHRVEVKVDAFPVGEYALLSGTDREFSNVAQSLAVQYFYISNLAYINKGNDYFILNRQEGQPMENVDVQVWERKYDYQKRKYDYVKREKQRSNNNGYVNIDTKLSSREVNLLQIELTTKGDHLFVDDNVYSYAYQNSTEEKLTKEEYEKNNQRVFFFTDRSIYRPGQIVYFKGILVTKDFVTKQHKIVPGLKTKVFLYDANGETVDSLVLTSNEYGSYNGKFILPENRLNGAFRIEDEKSQGQAEFSVEEYKRPKFQVEYDKQKGSYRLYDTISVIGNAKAYAGNTIEKALVKYRVVRQARFPYPWLLWKIGWPRMEEQEIAHGEVTTGPDGKFTINFAALPDKKIKKEYKPIFDYRVIADVTDINGETRSGETVINVSYQALQLSLKIPQETMPADSLRQVFVTTTNLAGEFEPATVKLSIWKLDVPNRLIRERYWAQPDQFIMTREEYLNYFPYDEYRDESKKESWKRISKDFELTDSSRSNSKLETRNAKLSPGWYAIEAFTIDKYGDTVKDVRFIQLTNSKGESGIPDYNWVESSSQTREPGETARIEVGSSANNLFVIKAQRGPDSMNQFDFIQLANQQKTFSIPINESSRGGFEVLFAFVKHNRFYFSSNYVNVPWSNKDLSISYETYRDKVLPGNEEKWKIKLTGYKNEKIAAEVLAGMYDASLDQFKQQQWQKPQDLYPQVRTTGFGGENNFAAINSIEKTKPYTAARGYFIVYDRLFSQPYTVISVQRKEVLDEAVSFRSEISGAMKKKNGNYKDADASASEDVMERQADLDDEKPKSESPADQLAQIRKNFNETAFFFPDLRTDSAGNIEFSFTMPEALTQWKWMTLAHTKDLAFGYSEKTIVTQKELMLQPNLPRFLREGDVMEISTKIVNLSDSEVTGQVQLQLIDAITNQSVDGWFQNIYSNQYFTVPAKQTVPAQFSVQIPHLFNKPVIVRLIAKAGNLSDGEENVLPVLTNKVLVTESMPLNVRGGGTKEFKLDKLLKSGTSETLQHHALTVEFTSNPAWYAVQALPYLMEFPYECAEQIWNRFYANALATKMVSASPKIKQVFEKWRITDTAALLSNLQKNQELKSVLLQETPWVMEAKSESEQKKRIALLFDMVRMSNELSKYLDQLIQMQSENGGFVWFKGGPDDRYITQYIISGIGHLKILDAIPANLKNKIDALTKSGLVYLDKRIKEDYDRLVKSKVDLTKQHLGYSEIHYLYMRSYFNAQAVAGNSFQAYNYYRKQAQQFWLQQNRYMQGMIALALFRTGDGKTSFDILRSLKQNALVSEEMGMYWKDIRGGYYWHQAPIETQSLLIEAFSTIYKDKKIVDDLKTWLLKNKQTNNWNTTKATADACYALLLQGTDWLANTPVVHIKLGDKTVSSTEQADAGTGYFKKTFDAPFVNASMGNISVSVNKPVNNPASAKAMADKSTNQPFNSTTWGSVYWQYFEESENITSSATPLSIVKKVFVEKNSDRGPVIEPIGENAMLKVGDKVKVRIEIRVDRDMEYVHMKDMRASAFEPVNVISSYKWQGGLGYYESTKDASTNFFFNYLPKGTHVFEYTLFASQVGNFSNGITTIQCMYAPEFSSHSEGIKVTVEAGQ